MKSLSVVFAGTPEFAVPALEELLAHGHRVAAVYTQPDRPAGRGRQVMYGAVKQCALDHGLHVEQPQTLRDPAAVARLAQFAADAMVVAAYGLILPAAVLAVPRLGCINIHASLLPRWRGAAPIHRALLAGDMSTGISIMQMDAGLDTGPVLLERALAIDVCDTAATLHDKLARLGGIALIEALQRVCDGSLTPRPQSTEGVTYAAKIRKEEALIDWSQPAVVIERQIRAFNPWPVAETRWQGRQLRIWEARLGAREADDAVPGRVMAVDAAGIQVATGAGVLILTRVQLAGRKAMTAVDFSHANSIADAVLTGA